MHRISNTFFIPKGKSETGWFRFVGPKGLTEIKVRLIVCEALQKGINHEILERHARGRLADALKN